MKLGLQSKVLLLFGVVGILSIVNAFLMFREYRNTNEKISSLLHAHKVDALSESFFGYLKDAETGQRGYLLTKRLDYLLPYLEGQEKAKSAFAELKKLVNKNPHQERRLAKIEPLLNQKLSELKETVDLNKGGDFQSAMSIVNSDLGKNAMVEIRKLINGFEIRQDQLLGLHRQSYAKSRQALFVMGFVQLAVFVAVLAYALVFVQRKIVSPVQTMTRCARDISFLELLPEAASDLDLQRVSQTNGGEVGDLARSFLQMQKAIELREQMLTERATQLEKEIHTRENMERRLSQIQKMEAIGKLSGGIAHDFNNLLSVISCNNHLMRAHLEPEQYEYADGIQAGVDRAAQLTQRLLAFSRKQILTPQQVQLNEILRDMESLLCRVIPENIKVEVCLAEGLWSSFVDPVQLENVILNLAINARDAMPDGGGLVLETSCVSLSVADCLDSNDLRPGDYVKVCVQDSGTGIDADDLEKVLEPYFTTKEEGKGTGLGLSMAFGFAKQSGGHLTIRSKTGEGTSVAIYLPRAEVEANNEESGEVQCDLLGSENIHGQHILLVEDGKDLLHLYKAQLESLGYRVTAAATGKEAIRAFETNLDISILLTDLILKGGMNGKELAEELTRRDGELQVVYMSGYADSILGDANQIAAETCVLKKPFSINELRLELAKSMVP